MAVSAVKKETAKNHDAEAAAAPATSPKKKGKLLKLMIILFVVASLGGGGAYWYLQQNKNKKPASAKSDPAKPPIFVPLEAFTVNLQLEDHPQFLQIGLSLKVTDNTVIDALKVHMPDVRDRVLLLLSARKASELLTVEGKRKLSSDIIATINAILSPAPAKTAAAAPAKKAPSEAKPPAEGEAAAPAEGEEKPAEEAAAPETAEAKLPPVLSVLFTSFIIQ